MTAVLFYYFMFEFGAIVTALLFFKFVFWVMQWLVEFTKQFTN